MAARGRTGVWTLCAGGVLCTIGLGCTDSDPPREKTEEIPEEVGSTPYVLEVEQPAPVLDLDAVGVGLSTAIETLLGLDPRPLHDAYEQFVYDNETTECPEYREYEQDYARYDHWDDHCETESGVRFQGSGRRSRYAESWDGDDYRMDDGYLYGEFEVVLPDGSMLDLSGLSDFFSELEADGDLRYDLRTYGSFRLVSPGHPDDWLKDELTVDIDLDAREYPDDGGITVSLQGGVAGMSGDISAFHAEGFYLYNEEQGSSCEAEPFGRLSVRDSEGEWYHVEFDGPAYGTGWSYAPACDGCGDVWYRGQRLGTACTSFAPLLEWGGGDGLW
jgi:hypothetical protein